MDRLGEAVAAHRTEDPETLIVGVLAAFDGFAGAAPHEDDRTIVVMKLVG